MDAAKCVEVGVGHSLNEEVAVFTEEEKTSRLALRLTGLENHALVVLRVKTLAHTLAQMFVVDVDAVLLAQESKDVGRVFRHLDVFVDDQLVINRE